MSHRIHLLTRWAMAALAALCLGMLLLGCSAPESTPEGDPPSGSNSSWGAWYTGEKSMDELIIGAGAIARVELSSVRQVVEAHESFVNPSITYVNALEFTYDVLEYLKGSGGTEITALAWDSEESFRTRAEAEASGTDLLASREARWDDREAIVFLHSTPSIPSTSQADRYTIGFARPWDEDGFTVASRWAKRWLPDAAAPTDDNAVRGDSGTEQRFLLEAPSAQASGATRTVQPRTIAMSDLKTRIATLEAEIALGDGTEEYRRCVGRRYSWPRVLQHYIDNLEARGGTFAKQFEKALASGVAAGTPVYVGGDYLRLTDEDEQTEPEDSDELVVISGSDADLFDKGWPLTAVTARPLPAGIYRFYWAEQSHIDALCDAMPELHRTENEVIVTVTPPPNTLHETFFDPVSLASGVGADSSNGVIKPAGFTVDGTLTSVTSLKYDDGNVVLSLSPHVSLSGQKLDFIELDGSVGLSLEVSSATENSSAGTLTWAVSDQPWEDGDELMLRISPIPAPSPGVTVTLTPRFVRENINHLDLDISWVDPNSCDSRYLVGIYDATGYNIIHFYGFHPAPVTTNYERQTGWSSDYIARQDWLVRVHCALANGDQTLVGEVELRSGLPSTP